MLERIRRLITLCDQPHEHRPDPQHVLNGALTLMDALYGPGSTQVQALLRRRDEIAKAFPGERERKYQTVQAVKGSLQNLEAEVDAGLLSSLERRITSDILSDLIQLARQALDDGSDGAKNVAAVLAAAAYEDAIRRIAREHAGVIGRDKLDAVLTKLKDEGLLAAPQLGITISYLSFRNHSLHADWEKIDRAGVTSVLGFVEQLLLKHFT